MSDSDDSSPKKLKFKKLTVKSGIRAGGDSLVSPITPSAVWSHTNSTASDGTITYPTKKCASTGISTTAISTSLVSVSVVSY